MQAQAALDQIAASNDVNSDLSMVKDVLSALALYQQQAYKQCYLVALGLVAGGKALVDKMKETVFGEEKQSAYYSLAYAYYLKAFSECTFLAARK